MSGLALGQACYIHRGSAGEAFRVRQLRAAIRRDPETARLALGDFGLERA
jgi:hypothetical protein